MPKTTSRTDESPAEWGRKGATLSDKTVRREYGLTDKEIDQGIRAGKLQYRLQSIYGNPFLRLLRHEVEALVRQKHGSRYLEERLVKTELAHINRELKQLKGQIEALEARKTLLVAGRRS